MTDIVTPLQAMPSEMLERAAADRHRPAFHFTSPAGWLNDPNGLTQRDGVFHLFYQFNPFAAVHDRIHWGHAISEDLVNWRDLPIALAPSEGPDVDGCWSGVLVYDGDVPTIVYSGRHGDQELPCLATGSGDLVTWTKDTGNPAIAAPPPDLDIVAFRDHCVWREGDTWRQIIGAGIRGQGGTALMYESPDLRQWNYLGPLLVGDSEDRPRDAPDWTGTMWECVDLFHLDADDVDRDVLVFSAWDEGVTHHPLYWTGHYEGVHFEPEALHRLDLGGRYFYAPQSMQDAGGRRVLFGWMQEGRPDAAAVAAGWSGVMSLPRVATLRADGSLHQAPAPEVSSLRQELLHDGPAEGASVRGDQLDLELDIDLPEGGSVELAVLASRQGDERSVYRVSRSDGEATIFLDRSRSSLDSDVDTGELSGAFPMSGDRVAVRVLVDHSALEAFVNGVPLAARAYPTLRDAVGVEIQASGARVHLRAWEMSAAATPR
jgi:beta-fructofuranosidase